MSQRSQGDQSEEEDSTSVERRTHTRRQAPTACADCELPKPPYVYMEDGRHYCIECALLVVETERIYPAGQRAEDITLGELLRDRFRLLPRAPRDRRATGLYDRQEQAS